MITLDTATMRDAFAVAIRGITPTAAPARSVGWSYTPSPRSGGRALIKSATRNFDLIFSRTAPTFAWVGGRGTAYKTTLSVATSYAGVEPETRDHLKAADRVDIHRALRRLIGVGGLPGLCEVVMVGEADERTAEASHYVAHVFEIHYHQATA